MPARPKSFCSRLALLEVPERLVVVLLGDRSLGHLAVVVRDRRRLLRHADRPQPLVCRRGLLPFVLDLVDANQVLQGERRILALSARSWNSFSARSYRPARR